MKTTTYETCTEIATLDLEAVTGAGYGKDTSNGAWRKDYPYAINEFLVPTRVVPVAPTPAR